MRKKCALLLVALVAICVTAFAQSSIARIEGTCGTDTRWTFDGYTLIISNVNKRGLSVEMENYNVKKNIAPWVKEKLNVRRVMIEGGITTIGSCAFANCGSLQEVVFQSNDVEAIGWAAFMNCSRLRNISLPVRLRQIETVAFANCSSLTSVEIPEQCRVGDQAFTSCTSLLSLSIHPTAQLGNLVFASEIVENDHVVGHKMYDGEIVKLPPYINPRNCETYGLNKDMVAKLTGNKKKQEADYDQAMSAIDENVPIGEPRQNTYALIIGNQNYRFVADVPFAIHDARVFAEYCKKTLGLPVGNIHITEDATKQMILEEELEDWLATITDRELKNLIVYYAGHGVPDVKNKNKAYMLPTDVRGTNPKRGIALDDLYARLGELAFNQTTVFIDACFSGLNRDNDGVVEGLRSAEIEAEEATLSGGRVVVFTAAQGNETAQAYPEKGHGLFTYYLLKELHDTYGNVNYGELSDRLAQNVSQQAMQMKLRKKQTPTTNTSEKVAFSWRDLRF
ncbi:MAG: leucine-rich repeat protein [Prevotella sp.]|nr:leucine-rich repeat protein [Prevotella sp.]